MQVSVELSLYPLDNNYEQIVWDFIAMLQNPALEIQTNGMSTQVFGEMDTILQVVGEAMKKIYAEKRAILVMKMGKGMLKLE